MADEFNATHKISYSRLLQYDWNSQSAPFLKKRTLTGRCGAHVAQFVFEAKCRREIKRDRIKVRGVLQCACVQVSTYRVLAFMCVYAPYGEQIG